MRIIYLKRRERNCKRIVGELMMNDLLYRFQWVKMRDRTMVVWDRAPKRPKLKHRRRISLPRFLIIQQRFLWNLISTRLETLHPEISFGSSFFFVFFLDKIKLDWVFGVPYLFLEITLCTPIFCPYTTLLQYNNRNNFFKSLHF